MHIAHHEHARRQVQIVQQVLMHVRDFLQALRREAQSLLDLLGSHPAQAPVQDVADMFEVDREGQDVRAALAVCAIEAVPAADRRQMQFHGAVQLVERIIHGRQLGQQFAVVVLQRLQEGPQHGLRQCRPCAEPRARRRPAPGLARPHQPA